jgi:hypothetical protein
MTLTAWLAQVRTALDVVDNQFGEQVTLLPWNKSEAVEEGPDTTRPTVGPVTAIFKSTRTAPANAVAAMASHFAESDAYLSINEEHLTACDFQQHDRVLLNNPRAENPSGVYEANYIWNSPFKRSRVFLIRLQGAVV